MKLTLGGCTSPSKGSDTRWSCGVETVGAVSTDGPVVSYGSATAGVRAGLSRADNRLKNEWSRRESNPRPLECHSSPGLPWPSAKVRECPPHNVFRAPREDSRERSRVVG